MSAQIAQVRAPTLVIHPRDDRVAPFSSGQALAAGIPGARLLPLDSVNHILLEDEPAFGQMLDAVRAFLREAPGDAARRGPDDRTPDPAVPPTRGTGRTGHAASGPATAEAGTRRRIWVLHGDIVSPMAALGVEGDAEQTGGLLARIRETVAAHGGLVLGNEASGLTAAM